MIDLMCGGIQTANIENIEVVIPESLLRKLRKIYPYFPALIITLFHNG